LRVSTLEKANLFTTIPEAGADEAVATLLARDGVRLERIVSKGHASPPGFWYDQPRHEWVVLLRGQARLLFDSPRREVVLQAGDYINIPAHVRHRLEWTDPQQDNIWLALFYD
jgi:cupin 2 domain-containing protein